MLKLTVVVLAITLAGIANAAGWRSLRLDGSSEDGFSKSVAAFQQKLTPGRRYVFALALEDIWNQGTRNAKAAEHDYTATDYIRQLDGLGYEQVVTFTDPTGETARRYRAAYNPFLTGDARQTQRPRMEVRDTAAPIGFSGQQERGGTYTNSTVP
jgi:hypothetical protein